MNEDYDVAKQSQRIKEQYGNGFKNIQRDYCPMQMYIMKSVDF